MQAGSAVYSTAVQSSYTKRQRKGGEFGKAANVLRTSSEVTEGSVLQIHPTNVKKYSILIYMEAIYIN